MTRCDCDIVLQMATGIRHLFGDAPDLEKPAMIRFCLYRRKSRLGANTVQVVLVMALVVVVALVGARAMTENAADDLNSTAAGLADPSELSDRF